MMLRKKGEMGMAKLGLLSSAAIVFVVAGIVTSFGSKVTADVSTDLLSDAGTGTLNRTASDAASNGTLAVGRLAKYLPLLGLVVAAAIIISIVVSSFRS